MDNGGLDRGIARTAAELRMQLAQMTAASQMLERNAWDEKGRGYLAALNQGICRMLRIVGRMELTERLAAQEPRLEPAPADLGELTGELCDRMEGLLRCTGVALVVSAPACLPARVDADLIRQMLIELVSNAAKAGQRVMVALKRAKDSAVFSVEDNGPGIPPERMAYLFSGKEEELPDWRRSGTGVAIARRIAVLHGGVLVADCAAGRGLRVTVSIPLGLGGGGGLESPAMRWDRGGFDETIVGLSHLLPAKVFTPNEDE